MKLFTKTISIFFIITNLSNAETNYSALIKPKPKLKPLEVLMIQLNSLKNNDNPYKDAGIKQTWEFAHPNNKRITGPYERFKQMIHSKNYEILISHQKHKIKIIKETNYTSIFKVSILSKNKKKYYYIWQIEKVKEGKFKNCWMTTGVSDPIFVGEII